MIKHLWKNQEGAVVVIAGLLLTVLLGFVGLALDLGNLIVTKTKMQNAVDAAVLGGGLLLPSTGQATKDRANSFITANNFTPVTGQPTFDIDAVVNPTSLPEINYSMTKNVQTYFMGLFGYSTVPITAAAKAVLQSTGSSGPFSYALFSGSGLNISGNATIHGSVHANGSVTLTGNINVNEPGIINGNVEGATGVSASGNISVDGDLSANSLANITTTGNVSYGGKDANAVNIAMPDYSSQLNTIFPNMTTYTGNQSWSGNIPDVTNGIYVNGSATLSGNVNSTGAIVATDNITISGNVTLGSNNQVCLYSLNGNITITGNISYGSGASAVIFAPHGTVTYSGNSAFTGSIVAQSLSVNGNGIYNAASSITALPGATGSAHVKLIQ